MSGWANEGASELYLQHALVFCLGGPPIGAPFQRTMLRAVRLVAEPGGRKRGRTRLFTAQHGACRVLCKATRRHPPQSHSRKCDLCSRKPGSLSVHMRIGSCTLPWCRCSQAKA
jgi:hypothetical protein